jgi:threonyl-tRNA synthetase
VVSREEALSRIQKQNEPYKIELLEAIPKGKFCLVLCHTKATYRITLLCAGEDISIYHIGDQWWDLCAGPHVESTGDSHEKTALLRI